MFCDGSVPGHLAHRVQLERAVRNDELQAQCLLPELLQPLCTIGLHAAVLRAPPVKGLL